MSLRSIPILAKPLLAFVLVAAGYLGGSLVVSYACPFCTAVSQTLRQEIGTMDAAVIAEALAPTAETAKTEGAIRLKVIKVLKGETLVKPGLEIEAAYFGKVEAGRHFFLTGVDPPKFMWGSPLALNDRSEDYLVKTMTLPEDAVERLKFYQEYLEDPDPMLARDAYDEFAIAPYADVKALGEALNLKQITEWVQNPEIAADRKRLYFTLLGIRGSEKDVPMLESMLTSTQSSTRAGLDALIACYLNLKGPSGLEMINKLFLTEKTTEYADTYAAIQALRFHGTETNVVPREKLVESLRLVLKRSDLADLVIPDLARWEDWSQIAVLVELFKQADPKNNWVRVPVVNYLRACPKPEAKEALKELETIDPAAVRRANTFFPVPTPAPAPKPATSSMPLKSGERIAAGLPGELLLAGDAIGGDFIPEEAPANPMSLLAVFVSAGTSLMIVYWLVLAG